MDAAIEEGYTRAPEIVALCQVGLRHKRAPRISARHMHPSIWHLLSGHKHHEAQGRIVHLWFALHVHIELSFWASAGHFPVGSQINPVARWSAIPDGDVVPSGGLQRPDR